MPELYLTPTSISFLTLLLLTTIISAYLLVRAIRRGKRFTLWRDGYLLAFFVSFRNAVRNWKLPAVRNFALILLIPMAVAILTYTRNIDPIVTFLYPIVSSIGLTFATFLFVLIYLSAQPERVSFIVKISGAALCSLLVVFGTIPWLITPAYADPYTPSVMAFDHRTIHFRPDGTDGYLADEIPFRWEAGLGERMEFQPNPVRGYDFDFPFFGQLYHRMYIFRDGCIGMGENFYGVDLAYHCSSTPIICPLLLLVGSTTPQGGSVFFRQEAGKAVITWYELLPIFPSATQEGTYTFQVVLFGDGSFDFNYTGLPDLKFNENTTPFATASAIIVKPANAPPGTADFTHLPMQIGPQGAIQDEYRSFRIYLHRFLLPVTLALVASSQIFLLGAVLVLYYGQARPFNSLLKGVQTFNTCQRDTAISILSNDEIGFLTESYNNQGSELNNLLNSLEQRVAERTQELAIANDQLRSEMEARALAQAQVIEHQRAVAALEERERLTHELHDGIGQVLGFINVQAQSANDAVQAKDWQAASQLLERIVEVAQEAQDDVRGYILGLKVESSAPQRHDFFAMLEQYCQHLEHDLGFQTKRNLPEDPPLALASILVETQLLYVIREALSNARTHSGQKEAEVTITYTEDRVRAVIEDHGIGLAALYPESERSQREHFGLGIMRERAQAVGGSLEIESTPGEGTRVIVCLPRQVKGGSRSGQRVLLVDDHPLFLEGMTNLVSGRGMQVVGTACDGLEAQEKARALHPEVILMDIEMPHCDGLEAMRHIKAEMPDVKVVMLTVSGEEQHLFDALRGGASGYLLKSLSALELIAMLEELLRSEISLSPSLATRMLEAFTSHKSPQALSPGIHPTREPESAGGPHPAELTERQMEILRLVAQGLAYKQVALQLGLAEVTIKYHMGEILARMHFNSRREAVRYVQDGGLK